MEISYLHNVADLVPTLLSIAGYAGTALVAVIGTLLWGRGGRKRLLDRLTALEQRDATTVNVNIGNMVRDALRKHERTSFSEGDTLATYKPAYGVVLIGTEYGVLTVGVNDTDRMTRDLVDWLSEKNLLRPLNKKDDK